ncbi:hypothetical protein AB433_10765 [Croceicoccus naphthovorans]|uniref:Uncharacterized protein n=1 Tax=Croceicoccus naphthovorans TaxID=1348774 RepID=A0A0G3XFL8_9SPHN|nr:hypothetical protein AB433_10765 [Croceicoccus naphthovorans]
MGCSVGKDRDRRGLHGDEAVGRDGPAPGAKRRAEAPAEDGEGRRFCFAMERRGFGVPARPAAWGGHAPPENRRPQPLLIRHG